MKMILMSLLLTGVSYAAAPITQEKVFCGEAKTFLPGPDAASRYETPTTTTLAEAEKRLNASLASNIDSGKTGIFDGKPIQMISKIISKPAVAQTISVLDSSQCIGNWRRDAGSCEAVSICVTAKLTYELCTPTKYDQDTGKRYAVCPNGSKVEF